MRRNRRFVREALGSNYNFIVTSAYLTASEDSYENGELDSIYEYSVKELKGTYSSFAALKEAISKITEFSAGQHAIGFFEDGRIDVQSGLLDFDGVPASQREIKDWKNGNARLATAYMTMHVDVVSNKHPITEEEAEELGIELW